MLSLLQDIVPGCCCISIASQRSDSLRGARQHYMASLLAAKGLEEETDCIGAMTYIHWWGNWKKMQPETYVRDEVCGDLIEQMRCASAPASLLSLLSRCALQWGLYSSC